MKVSFAVTAYEETSRGGPTILDSLAAAIEHPSVDEIVVCDDASSDYEGLLAMLDGTPKLKVFRNDENQGVFGNKLAAVSHCTGDWVINSDSDNVLSAGFITTVLAQDLDPLTWYCPSFARPKFDYRPFVGRHNLSNVEGLIRQGGMAACLLNTGNQTVHFDRYMDVFEQYLGQRADLMLPNFLGLSQSKRAERYWRDVFNACDSIMFNSLWLRCGGTMEVVDGLEYEHFWTGGDDSNYNRAGAEKGTLNDRIIADLLKAAKKMRQ
jgi:glycosyltransferase involved in cell wall biosynthesis